MPKKENGYDYNNDDGGHDHHDHHDDHHDDDDEEEYNDYQREGHGSYEGEGEEYLPDDVNNLVASITNDKNSSKSDFFFDGEDFDAMIAKAIDSNGVPGGGSGGHGGEASNGDDDGVDHGVPIETASPQYADDDDKSIDLDKLSKDSDTKSDNASNNSLNSSDISGGSDISDVEKQANNFVPPPLINDDESVMEMRPPAPVNQTVSSYVNQLNRQQRSKSRMVKVGVAVVLVGVIVGVVIAVVSVTGGKGGGNPADATDESGGGSGGSGGVTQSPVTIGIPAPGQVPAPTISPTAQSVWMFPTRPPSMGPVAAPTGNPTLSPSGLPSNVPSNAPSNEATDDPSLAPSFPPSKYPTVSPIAAPVASEAPTPSPESTAVTASPVSLSTTAAPQSQPSSTTPSPIISPTSPSLPSSSTPPQVTALPTIGNNFIIITPSPSMGSGVSVCNGDGSFGITPANPVTGDPGAGVEEAAVIFKYAIQSESDASTWEIIPEFERELNERMACRYFSDDCMSCGGEGAASGARRARIGRRASIESAERVRIASRESAGSAEGAENDMLRKLQTSRGYRNLQNENQNGESAVVGLSSEPTDTLTTDICQEPHPQCFVMQGIFTSYFPPNTDPQVIQDEINQMLLAVEEELSTDDWDGLKLSYNNGETSPPVATTTPTTPTVPTVPSPTTPQPITPLPTYNPTPEPTTSPTKYPTQRPTFYPTPRPTLRPTPRPTVKITPKPTVPYVPPSGDTFFCAEVSYTENWNILLDFNCFQRCPGMVNSECPGGFQCRTSSYCREVAGPLDE